MLMMMMVVMMMVMMMMMMIDGCDDDDDDHDDDDGCDGCDGCDDDGGDDDAADDDDGADDADPALHLLACWPAVGRQPLKSGQGPPGRGIAVGVSLLSVGAPTFRSGYKVPRCTVFCALPFFRSLWLKMGQHGPT